MARDCPTQDGHMMPLIPDAVPHAVVMGMIDMLNAGMLKAHLLCHRLLPIIGWSGRVGWLDIVGPMPLDTVSWCIQLLGLIWQRTMATVSWLRPLWGVVTLAGLDGQAWRVAGRTFQGTVSGYAPILRTQIARPIPLALWSMTIHQSRTTQALLWRAPWCAKGSPEWLLTWYKTRGAI